MKKTKSAGGVVVGPDNKILVVNQHGLVWSLPKGHIEDGESPQQAAIRETEEESGITSLSFIKELGSYKRFKLAIDGGDDTSEQKSITIFLYTTDQTQLQPIDPENPEARWVDLNEVAKLLTHTKDKAFFENVKQEVQDYITSRG